MQIAGSIGQLALNQQRIRQAAAETAAIEAQAAQRNRDLADANAIQEAWKDPNAARALMTGDFSPVAGRVQPKTLEGLTKALDEHRKSLLANTASQNSIRSEALGELTKTAAGLKSLVGEDGKPNLEAINAALPEALERLQAAGIIKNAGITEDLPKKINDISELDHFLAGAGALKDSIDQVLGQQKTRGEIQHIAAQTGQAEATSEAQRAQAELTGLKIAGKEPIQPAEQARISHEQAVTAETQRHNRVEEGIAASRNARENKIYEQTYGEGANEALRGVEPKLRVSAVKEAQKAADEHTKAAAAARDMQTFIDLAKTGNKAASAYIDAEGVLNINTGRGISRVNRQEIEQYAGAGNAYDHLAGTIKKFTTGVGKTEDVLNAMQELHQTVANNSDKTYDEKIHAVNQNYHANFKKVGGPAAPVPASGGTIRARDPNGVLHEAAAGTPLPAGWKLEQ
jgi:hypothetical protein